MFRLLWTLSAAIEVGCGWLEVESKENDKRRESWSGESDRIGGRR